MPSRASVNCLLSAAKLRSFTKAAEELFMTRQAVSRQIALLEKELGSQLFVRTTASVELTPVGEIYVSFFTEALKEWDCVRQKAASVESTKGETLAVGCLHWADLGNLVLSVVEQMRNQDYPVRVDWIRNEPHSLMQMLFSGKVDIIFTFENELSNERHCELYDSILFAQAQAMLVVSEHHPLVCSGATAKDFERETCFLSEGMTAPKADTMDFREEWLASGMNFLTIEVVPNRETLQNMVEMGRGISICTNMDRFSHQCGIKAYPLNRYTNILCIWRKDNQRTAVQTFVNAIRQGRR